MLNLCMTVYMRYDNYQNLICVLVSCLYVQIQKFRVPGTFLAPVPFWSPFVSDLSTTGYVFVLPFSSTSLIGIVAGTDSMSVPASIPNN